MLLKFRLVWNIGKEDTIPRQHSRKGAICEASYRKAWLEVLNRGTSPFRQKRYKKERQNNDEKMRNKEGGIFVKVFVSSVILGSGGVCIFNRFHLIRFHLIKHHALLLARGPHDLSLSGNRLQTY